MTHATRRAVASASLWLLLAATLVTVAIGAAQKAPCASGDWGDGRQYRLLCYTDIVPLYGLELGGGRLPYLDECPAGADRCDEYPVLTMYFIRAAGWRAQDITPFFWVNATGLALCAVGVAFALYQLAGPRALYFAAAPTLLVYAFVNWDLLAVAFATFGTLEFFRRRDGWSGALLGLGAAAKLYPALLVLPFALERIRERDVDRAVSIAVWAAVAFIVVNLPFALLGPSQWSTFFRFNAHRPPDWDSLWFVLTQPATHRACPPECYSPLGPGLVNVASLVLFVALSAATWFARRAREPNFARTTFAFPLVALFLLTNKVYSPQFSLWLLPLFALALPNLRLFVAFELTDVAVFVTRFWWFGRLGAANADPALAGFDGVSIGVFQAMLVGRALVLLACVVVWVLGRGEADEIAHAARLRPSLAGAER